MGQIWLAEQTSPVRRQVALKLIKAGMYDEAVVHRFQSERQSLAIMDHPAIAKVFEAGSTPADQPYFVMEYVPGLPITTYCDQKRLPARERLALLVKVCEGVQHAYQKAIIHRDLKPSNILVVEVDGKPVPRIIDFGIAKAISQQPDEMLMTRAGGMVGTPGYMSPEQADPSIPDVDTRTDVYSLGVVLYELLAGVLPFDVTQWRTKPFHEVLRQLHEDDPPNPSARISGDPLSTTTAANRTTDPRQLASLLRGDPDCITLKALEKDRSRRYGTPSELSANIGPLLAERARNRASGKRGLSGKEVCPTPQIWSSRGKRHGAAADCVRSDADHPVAPHYSGRSILTPSSRCTTWLVTRRVRAEVTRRCRCYETRSSTAMVWTSQPIPISNRFTVTRASTNSWPRSKNTPPQRISQLKDLEPETMLGYLADAVVELWQSCLFFVRPAIIVARGGKLTWGTCLLLCSG
jgi:non-specific serine/threonine protein kinase/serine/threonine-protein kinase